LNSAPPFAKKVLSALASLRLTVALLFLSGLVIFAGTWAQRFAGIWDVQERYFHSFFAWVPFYYFWFDPAPGQKPIPGGFPILGGYSLIVLLLANLLTAHTLRFKATWKDLFLVPPLALWMALPWFWHGDNWGAFIAANVALGVVFTAGAAVLHARRSGVILIHLGLIMLLAGEVVTSLMAVESQMKLDEGASQSWTQDIREVELAVVDRSPAAHDEVVVVPQAMLENKGTIADARLPFEVVVDRYLHNSRPLGPQQPGAAGNALATAGAGVGIAMVELPRVSGVAGDEGEVQSAFVTLKKGGQPLGTYLLSVPLWADPMLSRLNDPQPVVVDGKTYHVQLRYQRIYKPYTIRLYDFTHDRHVGTDNAKNFASRVKLTDAARGVEREVVVRMNDPLRYAGDTIFQSGFMPGDKTTILLVVSNPGWLVPYVACVVGAAGMLIHFGIMLTTFLRRQAEQGNLSFVRAEPAPVAQQAAGRKKSKREGNGNDAGVSYSIEPRRGVWRADVLVPAFVALLCGVYALSHAIPRTYKPSGGFDIEQFARTPVNFEGRTMPVDSLARSALKIVSGRESITLKTGSRVPAAEWLAEVLAGGERAREYKVFRIDHLQLKSLLGFPETEKLFSWNDIFNREGNDARLQGEVDQARKVEGKNRDAYQNKVVELYHHLTTYLRLASAPEVAELFAVVSDPSRFQALQAQVQALAGSGARPETLTSEQRKALESFRRILRQDERLSQYIATPEGKKDDLYFAHLDEPNADGHRWVGIGRSVVAYRDEGSMPASARTWIDLLNHLREGRAGEFNRTLATYQAQMAASAPADVRKANFELFFNRFDPFTVSIVLYLGVFLFACLSWLVWGRGFGRTAGALLALAFVVHTFGLIARMYISGRPPVTNLYSSAVFIGWGGVLLAAVLEVLFRNRIGLAVGALLGFLPLLVANGIAFSDAARGNADTMGQLQAVLDTNFWLATHVVAITIGYLATFVAGVLAAFYIIAGVVTRALDADLRKALYRMTYGVVCFAILFSFVGTILGGIWADQSWGRFWGWDPKENGAALIVLWNAILLHARWGGIVKDRGFMVLAIFGNIVTAWSWFGTNMLGIGLHAYGFMDSAPFYLGLFWFSQIALMVLGMLPMTLWRSDVAARGFEPLPKRAVPAT
jgi:ABC-type transport system involved in cytochrome c biogenesis permease subunit